jgi:phosphate-selective porin OprO/OprP
MRFETICMVAALLPVSWQHSAHGGEPPQYMALAPLSDSLVAEDSWDEPVVVLTPPAGVSQPAEGQPSLAARVEALERYIREQEEAKSESEVEQLPDAQSEPDECSGHTLTKIDTIAKPTYKWRGRFYIDGIDYDDDNATAAFFDTDRENEFGFDTVRFGVQGDIYENITYVAEVEFEGTEVDFKDVFAEMHSLPGIGHFRAGHFKEPIGLEELTSSRYDTFMEQSYATLTFAPGRNYGVMIFNHLDECQDASWFLGAFRHESDDSPTAIATQRDDSNDWSLASRFAWLPYYDEPSGGRYLVHLGGSYGYRNAASAAEFVTGAYIGNQPPIGVGALADSDTWNQLGAEFAVVWGALSVQSEYFHAFVTSGEQYDGAYVQVSYFLTGEHRGYNKAAKAFDRVHPFEPGFWIDTAQGCCCGRGAWELAAGCSYVNLKDGADIDPGEQERAFVDGFIVGVNWYLNPHSRFMFDYNHEITDFVDAGTPDSNANIFGVRWQVDW